MCVCVCVCARAAVCPVQYGVYMCVCVFRWIVPLIIKSVKCSLKHSDLYAHPAEVDSKHLLDKFNEYVTHLCHTDTHSMKPFAQYLQYVYKSSLSADDV